MKKILICMLAALAASCTNDTNDILNENPAAAAEKNEFTSKRTDVLNPENTANPFDYTGRIHNDILDAYLSSGTSNNSISTVSSKIDSISYLNYELQNMPTHMPSSFTDVQAIVQYPELQLQQIISAAPMSSGAKACMAEFMSSIDSWLGNDYQTIHQLIVSFEGTVLTNPQFTAEEKRIILTSSSITRYSIYYEKERKDKDWETSVGNRVGAVQGALDNSATAVTRSLLTGILSQNAL